MSAYKLDIGPFETGPEFEDPFESFNESGKKVRNIFTEYGREESRSFRPESTGLAWEEEVKRSGNDYIRWVQESLNRILGLRLVTDGAMRAQTRSAIRSFQERLGLPTTGLVGPDTERALIAAASGQSPGGGGTIKPAKPSMAKPPEPAPASSAAEFWENVRRDEFKIQPEAFEFESGLGLWETGLGQFEDSFGEFEGLPSKPGSATRCPAYQRGEIEKSRTQAGHLPSDVIEHSRGLLMADFGVDWRTPKTSVKDDSILKKWLTTIIQVVRANPSTNIRILGFSDCAGKERDNSLLRRGRARRVYELLYKLLGTSPQWKDLRPRINFIGAAPAGDYVADNSTVKGRAQNRGALIEHTREVTFEPYDVPPRPQPRPAGRCSFRPSRHGFKFANYFTLPSAITDPLNQLGINVGSGAYGLCGGMSFLAADLFSFGIAIPNRSAVPSLGSSLYLNLLERQLDSLKMKPYLVQTGVIPLPIPVPRPGFAAPVWKFWTWMDLQDTGRGSIAEKTAAEIAIINPILRRGKFAVFGLVLVNRSGSLTDNHQVLAYCLTQRAPNNFVYAIYDPNHPLRDDIQIEVRIVRGETQAFHVVPASGGAPSRTPIRGFFNMPYSPVKP